MTFDTGLKIFALLIRSLLNSAEVGKHIIFLNVDLYQRKDFKSARDKTLIVLENKKFVDRTTIYIIFKSVLCFKEKNQFCYITVVNAQLLICPDYNIYRQSKN